MHAVDPDEVETALATYYDGEGDERLSRPMDPRRLALRDAFVGSLAVGASRRILEIGPGPGRDAPAFIEAGHRLVAIDLSFEHARRCRATGARVVRGSVWRLPLRDASFDAIWTMSTLMHVPNRTIESALSEVARVLKPGAVAAIGVWGGPDVEEYSSGDRGRGKAPRLFSRRSNERWSAMLAGIGAIEVFESWADGDADDDFFYQWATVRRRGSTVHVAGVLNTS